MSVICRSRPPKSRSQHYFRKLVCSLIRSRFCAIVSRDSRADSVSPRLATTPRRTKQSKRSTARIFSAALWSSTKRVRSGKAAARAEGVAATVAEGGAADAAVMAAVAGAVDVEDAAAVVTVVVVVAEAAAIVKGTKKRSFRYGGGASLRGRSPFPC